MDGRFNYVSNIQEEENKQEVNEGPGILRRVWDLVWFLPKTLINGIIWFKDIFFGQDDATALMNGTDFATAFQRKLAELKLNEGFTIDLF